jgi:hypothetical protein
LTGGDVRIGEFADVANGRALKTLLGEDLAGGFEQTLAGEGLVMGRKIAHREEV